MAASLRRTGIVLYSYLTTRLLLLDEGTARRPPCQRTR
ncbi:hypothetical protein trd_1104 [Thermomicrobium roseum DSM 5159]|uniref:Uncharacterized protein n=1 Tax=Thermomicrobium roseum (strain ATCC 27502 / DSM 5159 / P-2) TaxID=309801 RepID=B9L0N3_THERP|nr:hypothetical protein trd_1104 [Thermomicrobium roseum DSM 5159]